MEIFVSLEPTENGYLAHLDGLPEFKLWGRTRLDVLAGLPQALNTYVYNWLRTTDLKSTKYKKEIAYVQRLRARGYYQSTAYRLLEIVAHLDPERLDLELIHCLQRIEIENLITS